MPRNLARYIALENYIYVLKVGQMPQLMNDACTPPRVSDVCQNLIKPA